MIICLNQHGEMICHARNRNSANYCRECGKPLRQHSIYLHDPGTLVGHYRIANVIGKGGFGAVYEAIDTQGILGHVALKETLASENVRGFQHEFEILRQHTHINLPCYYDMFELNGNGYLVMEYVPGQNLHKIMTTRQTPLLEKLVLFYADQLCDVLHYLHNQDPPIFHRDIKPANIRITPEGLIKLVDFGLLKQGSQQTHTTIRGLGTPIYQPFEQFGHGGTDQRSDIYALGATLYHLLTGQQPLIVPDRMAEPSDPLVAPVTYNPTLSPQVSAAIYKAMNIFQKDRQPNITTFRDELMGLCLLSPTTTSPHTTMPNSRPPQALFRAWQQSSDKQIFALPTNAFQPNASFSVSSSHTTPELTRSLFPVTLDEWKQETINCNHQFGVPDGYWCYVRSGVYLIGGWERGKTSIRITLPTFWIAQFPVTVAQFALFVQSGGYEEDSKRWWSPHGWVWKLKKRRIRPGQWDDPSFNKPDQPVIGVSWYEAMAFAAWVNAQVINTLPRGYVVRLPGEAEWEAAQTYDDSMQRCYYPWGNEDPTHEYAIYEQMELEHTMPVGLCPLGAAACGAQDMSGNIWEWTSSSAYDYPERSHIVRRDVPPGEWSVPVRGGSWWDYRTFMRCGTRDRYRADFPAHIFGFRLVIAPSVVM